MEHTDRSLQLAEEAAEWIVLLSADDESMQTRAQKQFETWKALSPQHQKVAQDIEQYLTSIQQLVQTPQQKTLTQSALKVGLHSSKKQKNIGYGGVFAVVLCSVIALGGYLDSYSLGYLVADVRTASGEWTTQVLADGTVLKMSAKSAVNLNFTSQQRTIELVQGEVYLDVAKDPMRPFVVQTDHGQIQALGTAFSVDFDAEATHLKMLHSKVRVTSANQAVADAQVIVHAGQAVSMNEQGIQWVQGLNTYNEQQKWNQHRLIFENQSLAQVLDELDQYSQGKILYRSAQLDQIKVNAVLPLDQPDHALQLLNSAFPQLKIYQATPYLHIVSLR
jgi:transmembrane sensor